MLCFGRAPTAEAAEDPHVISTLNLPFWIQKVGGLERRFVDGIHDEEE
jgi:hypothetical protein